MKAIIKREYGVSKTREFYVDYNGYLYLVIYGKHVNGGFCAIPDHRVACEMGEPVDVLYNMEHLCNAGLDKGTAKAIAEVIRDAHREGTIMKNCTICGKLLEKNKANGKCTECEARLKKALEARRGKNVRKIV
jgi:hypothetical protein